MSIFELKEVDQITPNLPIRISKLVIDNKCQFDAFADEVKRAGYFSEFSRAMQVLEHSANPQNQPLPKEKFRPLVLATKATCFEIKTHHLRLYLCKGHSSRVIVLSGYKNQQKSDLVQLVSLADRLLEAMPEFFKAKR